jgi:putative ribosome biogenesis GTPase RsgA
LADVREKGIKTFVILTHVDLLNHMKENDKLRLIDERINMLAKELDIKDRDEFICLENYHNFD